MTSILVVNEKHGTRYFDVTTEDRLAKVALYLLKSRFDAGWYPEPEPIPPLDFTEADIEKMPKSMWVEARARLSRHKHVLRQHREDYDEIKQAIDNKDGKLAFSILQSHDDYEYESVRREECEGIE